MEHEQPDGAQGTGPDLVAGAYVRGEQVGHGAAGPVHEALRVSDGLPVTLEALGGTDRLPERDTLLALRSPHLVPVLDLVEDDGTLLLVRRARADGDLAALLAAHGPLTELAALELLDQVLHGLEPAHVAEVVHGDLRPHQVLVDERGMARVTGLGSAPDPARPLAPEVAAGQQPGPASDVYGAGLLLLTMLTGSAALGGLTALPDGPVRALADRLLAARPEQRPANAVLARAAVGQARDALAPRPVAPVVASLGMPVAASAVAPAGRSPRVLAGAAALGVVAIAGVAVLLSGGSSAAPPSFDLAGGATTPSSAPSTEVGVPAPAPTVTVNTGPGGDAAPAQAVAGPPPPVPGGPGTPGATVRLLPRSAAAAAPAAPGAVAPAPPAPGAAAPLVAPPATDPAPPITDPAPPPTTDPAPPPTTDPAPPPTTDPAPPPTTDPAPPPTTDPAPPRTTDPAPPPTTDPAPPPTTVPAPLPTTVPPTLDPPPTTLPVTTPPVP